MASTESPVSTVETASGSRAGWIFLSITRIVLGFTFLWAFFDKLIGLGFSTCAANPDRGIEEYTFMCDNAWLSGGRVTQGYLSGSSGPLADFFATLGTYAWTDWIFMAGLLGVGLALMLGIGTRIGMISAVAMLTMMFLAHGFPFLGAGLQNPIVDSHVIQAVAVIAVVQMELTRQSIGLGSWWRKLPIVQKNTWLV